MKTTKTSSKNKKTIKKVKKPSLTKLRKRCDKLFAHKVKERGYCVKCFKSSNLQCAHIISRSYLGLRWKVINGVCLCSACHIYFTYHPLEWEAWITKTYGDKFLPFLKNIALEWKKEKIDYLEIIKELEKI